MDHANPPEWLVREQPGVRLLEAPPGVRLLQGIDDAALVVEACISYRAHSVVLSAQNLTERFFDLSSGEAGAILQKLRNYGIRIAVVCPPGTVQFSSRFHEMASEENEKGWFRLFESAPAAREWLTAQSSVV